jgi:hypothetical protein
MWDRDSHGLFDYESKTIVKKNLKCTGCCKLILLSLQYLNKDNDHSMDLDDINNYRYVI